MSHVNHAPFSHHLQTVLPNFRPRMRHSWLFSRRVTVEKLSTSIRQNYRVLRPSYIVNLSGKCYLKCKRKGYLFLAFDPPESVPWIKVLIQFEKSWQQKLKRWGHNVTFPEEYKNHQQLRYVCPSRCLWLRSQWSFFQIKTVHTYRHSCKKNS